MGKNTIFTELELKNLRLPSRLVRSATELFAALPDGHTDPIEADYYAELSHEPLGLIITAHTCVSSEGRSNPYQNALWDDEFIPDAEKIAVAAKSGGIPTVMQLGHGGMKADGNNGGLKVLTPDNMSDEEIKSTVKAFASAALRAKKAGFDGVMLHGAHMYLLSQFFYPEYNHRTDSYGGCAENRFRIIREAAEEIKKLCGDNYPLLLKINGDDRIDTEEYHADIEKILSASAECGIEAVEISGYSSCRGGAQSPYFIKNIARLKKVSPLPLIEVGGIRSSRDILDALEAGADAVSLSRPLICQPNFPSIIRDSCGDTVSECVSCGHCFNPLVECKGIRCPIKSKNNKCKKV